MGTGSDPSTGTSPLHGGPWIMRQRWHNLLFAHWPIDLAELRQAVPPELTIDTLHGQAWLGIVVFRLSGIKLRRLPEIKAVASFPEVNVRTYVTYRGQPGVYFLSLDADNPLAIAIAKPWYRLNYYNAEIKYREDVHGFHFRSRRLERGVPESKLEVTYRSQSQSAPSAELERVQEWLTERYCYYTVRRGAVYRCDIEHEPWEFQPATATFAENSMALSHGLNPPQVEPLLTYSRYMEAHVWPLRRADRRQKFCRLAQRSPRRQMVR